MQEYFCVPVIPCEDEILHTDEHPQCNDASCPCWEDYYEEQDRLTQWMEAENFARCATERFEMLPEQGGEQW